MHFSIQDENSLLWDRIVASEEREQCLTEAVAECSEMQSKASKMREENESLNKSVMHYKQIADLSTSQAAALLSSMKGDHATNNELKVEHMVNKELQQCELRLSQAQEQVTDLRDICANLVSLVQHLSRSNFYRHDPLSQVILGARFSELLSNSTDTGHKLLATSAASKLMLLIDTVENLQNQAARNEDALERAVHEKDLLETRLLRFQRSDILNQNTHGNDVAHQLVEVKSKLFAAQRDLRHSLKELKMMETKNCLLEKANAQLERDNANIEHLQLNGLDTKSSSVLGSIISLQLATGAVHQEEETTVIALNKVTEIISEYIGDLRSLQSKYSLVKSHNAEESRVSRQIECLNTLVKEKNRVILALKEKLSTQTKHPIKPSKRHEDSFSSFGSIESIGNLAKCSPKRREIDELALK